LPGKIIWAFRLSKQPAVDRPVRSDFSLQRAARRGCRARFCPAPDNAVVLYNNIKRLKLDVTTHVPIHGAPGPQAEFDRIVAPVAARTPQQGGGG
jgi:hypothetical protein